MANVLVVDDAVEIVRLLSCRLTSQGYDVSAAYSGLEALELASADPPDVVLLDIEMPDMDGIEVCRRLKADAQLRVIPVILVTVRGLDEDVVAGLDAGADDYVVKPFSDEVLAARLRCAVRIKQTHDAIARINRQLRAEIAERKRLERELVQAQKLEAVGQLATGIAHEINTPTQYIGDNTRFLQDAFGDLDKLLNSAGRLLQAAKEDAVTDELIAELDDAIRRADMDYLSGEIPAAIRQSLEGIDRVASIVRAMNVFSHPDHGRKLPIDLNRTIECTLTVARSRWKYVADLVTDFDRNLPAVTCLPGEISQVVLNLIVNAAQAIAEVAGDGSRQKGTITVRTRRDEDWAVVSVEDTGPGIPEAVQSKVFDPFFTTKEVGQGTGQGLFIAHAIVTEKHGGTIRFETRPGLGTKFIVRLPISNRPEAVSVGGPRQEEPAASG